MGVGYNGAPKDLSSRVNLNTFNGDTNTEVRIDAGNYVEFGAPWTLTGYIEPGGPIKYSFLLKQSKEEVIVGTNVSGSWTDEPVVNEYSDNALLDSWLVCIQGKYQFVDNKQIFIPSIPDTSGLETIGHLRAHRK